MKKRNTDSFNRQRTNREKSKSPSKTHYWCYTCDMALVGDHGKCPVCGAHLKGQKHHKQSGAL